MANTLKLGNGKWATGKDTVMSFSDTNNNFKPLPFDFSRASSATVVNQSGLIETVGSGEPRIDFLGNTKGALKLEPTRSNLIPYSQDFSNVGWTKSNCSIISNSVISPDGTLNADKLVENTSNASHQVYKTLITNSGDYSNSIFVKAAERSKIRINSGSNSDRVDFDLSNGTVISQLGATGNIVSVSNGWYKCNISWNTVSVSAQYFLISLLDDSGTQQYQGDGTSGVYIWGAQLEVGSYATSYIPTSGQSGGVTRVADFCNNGANNQVINSTEGVLYAELSLLDNSLAYKRISISDGGSTSKRIAIGSTSTTNQIQAIIVDTTLQVNLLITLSNIESLNKIAFKYKANDCALWVNGVEVDTATSAIIPNGLDTLNLDEADGTSEFYGNIKDVRVYNTALTDAELQALTTI